MAKHVLPSFTEYAYLLRKYYTTFYEIATYCFCKSFAFLENIAQLCYNDEAFFTKKVFPCRILSPLSGCC